MSIISSNQYLAIDIARTEKKETKLLIVITLKAIDLYIFNLFKKRMVFDSYQNSAKILHYYVE